MRSLVILCSFATLAACRPPDIDIRETPIIVTDQQAGYGEQVRDGDSVIVHYTIELPDGRVVMRHRDYRFKVGTDSVIRGIDEAILGMRIGGSRQFTCPPHKHWGRAGYGNGLIPPTTDLLITLQVEEIEGRTVRRRSAQAE